MRIRIVFDGVYGLEFQNMHVWCQFVCVSIMYLDVCIELSRGRRRLAGRRQRRVANVHHHHRSGRRRCLGIRIRTRRATRASTSARGSGTVAAVGAERVKARDKGRDEAREHFACGVARAADVGQQTQRLLQQLIPEGAGWDKWMK